MQPVHPLKGLVYRNLVREWLARIDLDDEFAELDINGDGYLSRSELQRATASKDPKWQKLPEALLAMADVDGDGMISLQEFRELGELLRGNHALQQELAVDVGRDPQDFVFDYHTEEEEMIRCRTTSTARDTPSWVAAEEMTEIQCGECLTWTAVPRGCSSFICANRYCARTLTVAAVPQHVDELILEQEEREMIRCRTTSTARDTPSWVAAEEMPEVQCGECLTWTAVPRGCSSFICANRYCARTVTVPQHIWRGWG
eukprot:COSAG05_NODE_173_length_14969_cov_29.555884_10_plen_258_part_00